MVLWSSVDIYELKSRGELKSHYWPLMVLWWSVDVDELKSHYWPLMVR